MRIKQFKKAPSNRGLRPISHLRFRRGFQFKKAPSNRGLRLGRLAGFANLVGIQKSPIKSGIKTLLQVD